MGALGGGHVDIHPAVLSDGQRYVAMQTDNGRLSILDTDTLTSTAVTVPRDCPMSAAGFGQVVLACRATLVGLSTGTARAVAGARRGPGAPDEFDAIGAQWLWGSGTDGRGAPVDVFVNWHTGIRRIAGGHRNVVDLAGPGLPNLDDPALRTPARCSRQWIYARQGHGQVIAGLRGELVLQRCGQRASVGRVLDTCAAGPCEDVQLSAGMVTWSRAGTAFSYTLRGGRRRSWRLAGFAPLAPGDAIEVVHTARIVVLAVRRETPAKTAGYGFYAARR